MVDNEDVEKAFEDLKRAAIAFLLIFDLFLVACLLSSCGPKRVESKPVLADRPTYSYRQDAPNQYVVWLKTSSAEKDVKAEICPKGYTCTVQEGGRIIFVERIRQ